MPTTRSLKGEGKRKNKMPRGSKATIFVSDFIYLKNEERKRSNRGNLDVRIDQWVIYIYIEKESFV